MLGTPLETVWPGEIPKEEEDPETFAVEYGKAWASAGGNVFLPGEIVDLRPVN
jgi:hypothetical protein